MADLSSQKIIGKNNAPRVQIEYDVEIYGSQKKVQLPFVTGVMADLSGTNTDVLPAFEERKFIEFDIDNFDSRMAAIRPATQFYVENTLANDGTLLDVNLAFESMDDFTPGAIAQKIPEMAALLEARERLTQLITYMDGKSSAEETIKKLLEDPDLLIQLTEAGKDAPEVASPDLEK